MLSTILYFLACSFAALFVLMSIAWLIQYRNGNAGIVDIFWGISFPVSVSIYLILVNQITLKTQVLAFMVSLWGIRLAIYLFGRNWNKQEDARYAQLKKEWGNKAQLKMFFFFQFQALLSTLLSFPFILIILQEKKELSVLEITALLLWTIGLTGETIADEQLKYFKKNNPDKKQVCSSGLWFYSRHPNYFFEWIIWVSYFIFALNAPYGWLSFLSPLLMLHFLLNVTGIKYSEEHMLASKGEAYRIYKETTSAFIPLPKNVFSNSNIKTS